MRTNRLTRLMPGLPLAALLLTLSPALAADENEAVVIKTYDIADLVRPIRDYPLAERTVAVPGTNKRVAVTPPPAFGGGFGSAGGGTTASPEAELLEHYQAMIKAVVATGTWKEEGGSIGSMRPAPSRTSLVVSQTKAAHEQIATLLTQLREQSSTRHMVRVRAWWKVLDPTFVESMQALPAGDERTRAEEQLSGTEAYRQAQVTCYNGQTVGVQSGSETSYVSDVTPVVGTNAVGYDTTVDTAFSGVRLQVTPQLIPGGSEVILDLQSAVSDVTIIPAPIPGGGPTTRPFVDRRDANGVSDGTKVQEVRLDGPADAGPGSATNVITFIQRPQVSDQSFNTTLRVPLGRSVIVSGVTLPPDVKDKAAPKEADAGGANAKPSQPTPAKPRTLYLIVRVEAVQ